MSPSTVSSPRKAAQACLDTLVKRSQEIAAQYGSLCVQPSHLLQAVLGRSLSLSLFADRGLDPDAVQARLIENLQASCSTSLKVPSALSANLEAGLTSLMMLLSSMPDEYFEQDHETAVLRHLINVIERHADQDPVCSDALAMISEMEFPAHATEEDVDSLLEEIAEEERRAASEGFIAFNPHVNLGLRPEGFAPGKRKIEGPDNEEYPDTRHPDDPPIEPRQAQARPGPAPQPGKSQLARDAAEVEAMVARSFRSLSEDAGLGKLDPVIGREEEIARVLDAVQRRRKRSVILHGPSGVGKTAIAEGLAIALRSDEAPESLAGRTVYELSLSNLVAGARYRGDFEERMTKAIDRIAEEGAIVFVDEIHTIMGLGSTQGRGMDGPNILKPALARGDIILIGATTTEELADLRQDKAIMRRFELIEVREPDRDVMRQILDRAGTAYLDHHQVYAEPMIFEELLNICDRFIPDQFYPDKAFDLLDRACVEALRDDLRTISLAHLQAAAVKSGALIPVPPSQSQFRVMRGISEKLKNGPNLTADLSEFEDHLRLKLLSPATHPGALACVIIGDADASVAAARDIANALGRRITSLPKDRLKEPGAGEWLTRSNYASGPASKGALVEALETGPEDILLFEDIDAAQPEVTQILQQLIDHGAMRSSNGHQVCARKTILMMTARHPVQREIGFTPVQGGAQAPDPQIPNLPKAVARISLYKDAKTSQEHQRIAGDIFQRLDLAGYEIEDRDALAKAVLQGLSARPGAGREIRLELDALIWREISARPKARSWTVSLPDYGVTGTQLKVTIAAPKLA